MTDAAALTRLPLVTVSLVTYNGMSWVPACLASLARQSMTDFELIVVDNASSDGTLAWLRGHAQHVTWMSVASSRVNLGFAAAQNRNIYKARGEFVCLLNQDIELDERFLQQAVEAFEGRPRVGAVQGRLYRLMPNGTRTRLIDTTGLAMHRSRRVVSRGQGKADGHRWATPGPVWGADGPAPVYRRTALIEAQEPRTAGGWEILDEDFFMYKEDVDLAWRLRRIGWLAWYQPSAVAWHARTASAGDSSSWSAMRRANLRVAPWIRALSWRNQRLMQLKNERLHELWPDLAPTLAREVAAAWFVTLFDRRRLLMAGALISSLSRTHAKRKYLFGRVRGDEPAH